MRKCDDFQTKQYQELEEYIRSFGEDKSALISVLHKAQELFGYLPKEVQVFISKKMNLPVSDVHGVITFYSYFTETPTGEHVIDVCLGTACFVKGSGDVLDEFERKLGIKVGQTTPDGRFTLQVLRCVGACGLAPVVTIDNKVYGHFTKQMVDQILKQYSE